MDGERVLLPGSCVGACTYSSWWGSCTYGTKRLARLSLLMLFRFRLHSCDACCSCKWACLERVDPTRIDSKTMACPDHLVTVVVVITPRRLATTKHKPEPPRRGEAAPWVSRQGKDPQMDWSNRPPRISHQGDYHLPVIAAHSGRAKIRGVAGWR